MAPGGEDPRPRKQPRKRGTAVLLSRGRPRRLYIYIYVYICGKLHVIAGHLFATVHSLLSVTQLPSTFLFFHPTFSSSPISPRPFSSPPSHTHIYTYRYTYTQLRMNTKLRHASHWHAESTLVSTPDFLRKRTISSALWIFVDHLVVAQCFGVGNRFLVSSFSASKLPARYGWIRHETKCFCTFSPRQKKSFAYY